MRTRPPDLDRHGIQAGTVLVALVVHQPQLAEKDGELP